MQDCKLVEIIDKHNKGTPIATNNKGNPINLILATRFLFDQVVHTSTLHSTKRDDSNHVVCFVELHQHIFARNPDPISQTTHGFTSKQKYKSQQFGNVVDDQLQHHTTLNTLLELLPTSTKNKNRR